MTASFRFLHAADLHLDTPFEGLGRYPSFVNDALRDASIEAFGELVRLAIEREVLFCVFAGDIYDGAVRGLRAQRVFRDGLAELAEHGIRSFVVHGNHDPVKEGWSAEYPWPDEATEFPTDEVATGEVHLDGELVALVQGISYATTEMKENLALRYQRDARPVFQVGLLHCNLGGDTNHGDYSPCKVDDLARAGLDYWALGHIHLRAVSEAGDTKIVYPGNLQGRSPKPSERGAKGAVIVAVDSGRVEDIEFVALDRVRFVSVTVAPDQFASMASLADLDEQLDVAASLALAANDGRSLVVRATIEGRGPVHRDLAGDGQLVALRDGLRERCATSAPFVWWDRIDDASSAEIDLDQRRRGDDLIADLIATFDRLGAPAAGSTGPVDVRPAELMPVFSSSLRNLIDDWPDPADPELLEAALMRAIGLLAEADR